MVPRVDAHDHALAFPARHLPQLPLPRSPAEDTVGLTNPDLTVVTGNELEVVVAGGRVEAQPNHLTAGEVDAHLMGLDVLDGSVPRGSKERVGQVKQSSRGDLVLPREVVDEVQPPFGFHGLGANGAQRRRRGRGTTPLHRSMMLEKVRDRARLTGDHDDCLGSEDRVGPRRAARQGLGDESEQGGRHDHRQQTSQDSSCLPDHGPMVDRRLSGAVPAHSG